MADQTMEQPASADATELATLRRVNAELLQVKHTLKARVAALEGEGLQLAEKADKAIATMRAAVIDQPLMRLAVELSPVPAMWLAEFHKDYNIEATDDGALSLLTKDGEAVKSRDGKPIEFTHNALYQLLVGVNGNAETERAIAYKHLMKYAGASGGVGRKVAAHARSTSEKKDTAITYGLR